MPNWKEEVSRIKEEVHRFKDNNQLGADLEIKARAQELNDKEKEFQLGIMSDYENIILPGFKILDSFHIKEALTEIRDQIWKVGEILKRPNNFKEYELRSGYSALYYDNPTYGFTRYVKVDYERAYDSNDVLPLVSSKLKIGQIEYERKRSKIAKYVLIGPETLHYVAEGSSPNDGSGDRSFWDEHLEAFRPKLQISINDGKYLHIGIEDSSIINGSVLGTNIEKQSREEIKENIRQLLTIASYFRRDYSKVDPEVLRHPELYRRYLDSHQPQKRGFLDVLFEIP